MAESKPISSEEILALKELQKGLNDTISIVQRLQEEVKETYTISAKIISAGVGKADTKAIDATTKALSDSNEARKKQIELETAELKLQEQLNLANKAEQQALQEQLKLKIAEQKEVDKSNKAKKTEEKALKDQASAYKQASARLNDLRNRYKDLAVAGNANAFELKHLKEEVIKLDTELKNIDKSVGQFQREVGNYEGAINSASAGTGEFGTIISSIQSNLVIAKDTLASAVTDIRNFGESFANAEGGIGKAKKAIGLFGSALKVSGIAVLVGVLASLVAYFKTTEEGADQLGKTIATVKAGFEELVRTLAKSAPFIIGLFGDIYKAGYALFNGLTIGFRIVNTAVINLTKSLISLAKLDFKEALKSLQDVGTDTTDKINGLVDSFKDLDNTNFKENIEGIGDAFSGIGERISEASKRGGELFDLFDELEEKQIRYAQQLQKLTELETEYSKIAGDTTESFVKREKAQADLEKTSLQRAELERDIAREEFEINLRKVALDSDYSEQFVLNTIKQGKAQGALTTDLLTGLNEYYLKAEGAENNLLQTKLDVERSERELQQRKMLTTEKILQESVETELSAIKTVAESSKNSFDLRGQALEEFSRKNTEAFKKEVELINEANKGVVDPRKLIELSGTALEEYIQSLGIQGDKVTKELSDVANKYKKNNAELFASRQKLADDIEKIRIREANAQNKIEQEDFKRAIEVQEKLSKRFEEILSKRAVTEIEKAFDLRKDAITAQAEFELQNADLTANEKLAIGKKLANDLVRLEEQKAEAVDKINKAIRDKRLTEAQKIADALVGEIRTELDKENNLRQQALDRQIEQRESNISAQQALFEQGRENQLAFERAQLDKLELQRKDAEERSAKQAEVLQLIQATYQSYIARLKANEKPSQALLGASADTLLLKELAKRASGAFWEGSERIEDDLKGNKVHNGRDGYIVAVDGGERVLNTAQNKLIGDMSNDELASLAYQYNKGSLSTATNIYNSIDLQPTLSKLSDIHEELASRPTQVFRVNEFGQIMEGLITKKYVKKTVISPWRKK